MYPWFLSDLLRGVYSVTEPPHTMAPGDVASICSHLQLLVLFQSPYLLMVRLRCFFFKYKFPVNYTGPPPCPIVPN
jgi:hypothetical protein